MTNYEKVKEYVLTASEHGELEETLLSISNKINVNVGLVSKIIKQLENDNVIKIVNPPKRGKGQSLPLFKVLGLELKKIEILGEEFWLRYCELGWCMSKDDLVRASLSNTHRDIDDIIQGNSRLFKENSTILDGRLYFNSKALISILMKFDVDNCHSIKQKAIHELQDIVATSMVDFIVKANVVLTPDNKIRIMTNLEEITEVKKEDLAKAFENLQNDMISIVEGFSKKLEIKSKEIEQLKGRNEMLSLSKDNLITENNHLKMRIIDCKA